MLRLIRAFAFLMLLPLSALCAETSSPKTPYGAGFSRISVPDAEGAFDVMIWYPIAGVEKPWQAGPFTVNATLNGEFSNAQRFPLVLLSHGSGGAPLAHRQLAESLARQGIVVVAPNHLGDAAGRPRAASQATILTARPRQAIEALKAVLDDKRFADHVDPDRMGMIGFSAGGYTGLVLAGASPDFDRATAYCAGAGRSDPGSCRPGQNKPEAAPALLDGWQRPTMAGMKALVLMDPLSMFFASKDLSNVTVPILLLRPKDTSYLNAEQNALALSQNLPSPPKQIEVDGSHFVFIDPCPDALMLEAPSICKDADGVDRISVHRQLEAETAKFLLDIL